MIPPTKQATVARRSESRRKRCIETPAAKAMNAAFMAYAVNGATMKLRITSGASGGSANWLRVALPPVRCGSHSTGPFARQSAAIENSRGTSSSKTSCAYWRARSPCRSISRIGKARAARNA